MSYCLHYAKKYQVEWSDNTLFNWGWDEFNRLIIDNCKHYWRTNPDDGDVEGIDKEEFIALRDKIVNDEVDVNVYFEDENKEDILAFMNEIIDNAEEGIDYFRFTWF